MGNPVDRRLFSLLGRHLAMGVVTGLAIAGLFYGFDVGGLRTVTSATREAGLAMFIFAFAMAFTFGAIAMGVGVMLHPRDPDYGARMGRREKD